jgi:hypothetical protein
MGSAARSRSGAADQGGPTRIGEVEGERGVVDGGEGKRGRGREVELELELELEREVEVAREGRGRGGGGRMKNREQKIGM